jgi:molecular chaperone HtpG
VRWESAADGEFTVESLTLPARGTAVTLHLKADAREFADPFRLRGLIRQYSDHIGFPVRMRKEGEASLEYEVVNQAKALWTLPRTEIPDEEYKQFYQYIAHDFTDPLAWSHNKVEGKREYISLLYVPGRAPFDLWQREGARGLRLYVRRVFIMDDAEQFLPLYLRFIKGVVDSSDLPLNVSRELLQQDPEVEAIRGGLTKRVLDLLARLMKEEPDKYATFWKEFGQVLKEGIGEDATNKDRIAKLLRFASTNADSSDQTVSFADYVARMKEGQDKIYYVTADNYTAARNSPHLEIFRKKGVEVLLLTDRVDEWMLSFLNDFDGKELVSVAKGGLDLGKLEDEAEKKEHEQTETQYKDLVEKMKTALADKAKDVRITFRLTDSPACLVADEHELSANLVRMLKAAGQNAPESKPILEINPNHPLVTRLKYEDAGSPRFADWSHILFDQAMLAEGGSLSDPAAFVKRLNEMLLATSAK